MRLQPGDYYEEDGLLVLTDQYLLRRGSCCGSRCRHCPYDGEKKSPAELNPPGKDAAEPHSELSV